jgi:hypothetical protein
VIPLNTWSFIGVSYDKASSKVIGLVGAMTEQRNLASFNVYTQVKTIIFGKRAGQYSSYLLGGMSCAMMFSVGLSIDDMNRAKKYCMKRMNPDGRFT